MQVCSTVHRPSLLHLQAFVRPYAASSSATCRSCVICIVLEPYAALSDAVGHPVMFELPLLCSNCHRCVLACPLFVSRLLFVILPVLLVVVVSLIVVVSPVVISIVVIVVIIIVSPIPLVSSPALLLGASPPLLFLLVCPPSLLSHTSSVLPLVLIVLCPSSSPFPPFSVSFSAWLSSFPPLFIITSPLIWLPLIIVASGSRFILVAR